MSKYRYIFLGSQGELSQFSYSDLKSLDNVTYIPGFYSQFGDMQRVLFRLHTNNLFNKIVNLPFKSIWKGTVLKNIPIIPKDGETLVYIFQRGWADYEPQIRFIECIKSKNPNAKFILFLEDLFFTYRIHDRGNYPYTLEFVKEKFDLVFSFDQGDCKRYGFIYHPLVFSKYRGADKGRITTDVYFLGAAKNRLSEILKSYEILSSNGLKCDFHIAGVKKEERKYVDEIDYEPNISYMENLSFAAQSKCILELMQKGGKGYTQRTYEAIGLGKILLTNNEMIQTAPFFSPELILQFDTPENITKKQIEVIKMTSGNVDFKYIDKISPVEFVTFIQFHLEHSFN